MRFFAPTRFSALQSATPKQVSARTPRCGPAEDSRRFDASSVYQLSQPRRAQGHSDPCRFWYSPRRSYMIWSCTMPAEDLHELTLAEAARLISTRKLSPVEYTAGLLARIEALEPQLNAFITRTPDVATVVARTAEAE